METLPRLALFLELVAFYLDHKISEFVRALEQEHAETQAHGREIDRQIQLEILGWRICLA